MAPDLLVAEGVSKRFGGLRAVDDMHVRVAEGELVGLIGPNGAGKSTFFDCLSGFTGKDAGKVRFAGKDLSRARRHVIGQAGMTRTFQMTSALERMTVLENVMLAGKHQPGESLWGALRGRPDPAELAPRAMETLRFFGLEEHAEAFGASLSGGQKKLLDLARALMTEPRMMLLDEPLAGVNPSLRRTIMRRIEELQEGGMTFLLIEHDMQSIFGHCDRVVVMAEGKYLMDGPAEEVQQDARVKEAYLGT